MNDKRAEEIVKIFRDAGIIIELGAHFSVKGQVAQLLNGCEKLIASQPAVEADAQKPCRCYKFYKQQNSYSFCPDCGRDLRTA